MSHQATISYLEGRKAQAKRNKKKHSHIEQRLQDVRTAQLKSECEKSCRSRIDREKAHQTSQKALWCGLALLCGSVGTLIAEHVISSFLSQ